MPDEQKKFLPIDYTHREFSSLRDDLLEMAERFYPENFQDFSEASFGSMMIDAVAYVGDQLSFYLDYSVNESFLDTAFQYSNVIRHGRALGYKAPGRPSTYGEVALYVQVPSADAGLGPDASYIPLLKRGTTFQSTAGLSFMLTDNVDFSDTSNPIIVSKVDQSTGAPTHYAIKAYGNVVSGRFGQKTVSVGPWERFKRIQLNNPNIVEIISVYDSAGNQYYEVEYLAQDMVYKEMANNNFKNDNVPSVLRPMLVSRKFVVEHDEQATYIQFGSGDESATNIIANPQNFAIDVFGKSYVTDTSFDPTRLSKNRSFGICPANTTLYITYRVTNPNNSNAAAGQINRVGSVSIDFVDRNLLSTAKVEDVEQSLEVSNEKPITGDVSRPTTGEIKRRIFDTFPTQNRAVTQADYENITYRMPAKYGSIKRCTAFKDQDALKRNLNLYVISEDPEGKLVQTNSTIKNNLKTWLNNYRMINDTVDILDPYIINLGVEFVIKPTVGENRNDVLSRAIAEVSKKFSSGFFIAEPLYISDIYSTLKEVNGVLDVVKVKITNQTGGQYSPTSFNVEKNISQDGSYLLAPANAIFEIKYPSVDIKGKVR